MRTLNITCGGYHNSSPWARSFEESGHYSHEKSKRIIEVSAAQFKVCGFTCQNPQCNYEVYEVSIEPPILEHRNATATKLSRGGRVDSAQLLPSDGKAQEAAAKLIISGGARERDKIRK